MRLLVANRGEIAVRIFRACRDLGIETVAVFSDADRESPHVTLADHAVRLGPAPARESYLSMPAILEAARQDGRRWSIPATGSWPRTPRSPAPAGGGSDLRRPVARRDRGDGLEDREPAADGEGGRSGRARNRPAAGPHARLAEFGRAAPATRSCSRRRPAAAARGCARVATRRGPRGRLRARPRRGPSAFSTTAPSTPRKDRAAPPHRGAGRRRPHGRRVAIGERECSLQRRHQKVIEECPSPVVDEALRERLLAAAVAAAEAVGYTSCGTVEFLLAPDGSFYFLEMNTRLQVEHPVTEEVWGVDLVAEMIRDRPGRAAVFRAAKLSPAGSRHRVPDLRGGPAARLRAFARARSRRCACRRAPECATTWESRRARSCPSTTTRCSGSSSCTADDRAAAISPAEAGALRVRGGRRRDDPSALPAALRGARVPARRVSTCSGWTGGSPRGSWERARNPATRSGWRRRRWRSPRSLSAPRPTAPRSGETPRGARRCGIERLTG